MLAVANGNLKHVPAMFNGVQVRALGWPVDASNAGVFGELTRDDTAMGSCDIILEPLMTCRRAEVTFYSRN